MVDWLSFIFNLINFLSISLHRPTDTACWFLVFLVWKNLKMTCKDKAVLETLKKLEEDEEILLQGTKLSCK